MHIYQLFMLLVISIPFVFLSCSSGSSSDNGDNTDDNNKPSTSTTAFAKGADVSWLTEMENAGKKFYDSNGNAKECMALLKSIGMNAIRLRVWVNPSDGWCNKDDVLKKAVRANKLGMRIMIDFHYSDSWADPSKQTIPSAWQSYSLSQLETAVASHTKEVLNLLKTNSITPEWVQIGNETSNGMLWEIGKASTNMANYAALNNAGYDAAKSVFPNIKVIVHLDKGYDSSLYSWMFGSLKSSGGKWDVIGMSLYPSYASSIGTYSVVDDKCIANINSLVATYKTPVMICEVGMPWDDSNAKAFLTDIITKAKAVSNGNCLGVFYWEPEAYNGWKNYSLGAFDNSGKPTSALDAFK